MHRFDNGLWLLAEPVPGAQSLAMSLLTPAGLSREPQERQGVAPLLAEMINRGAGDLDARAHNDALDYLGINRGTSVETHHLNISATMIGSQASRALPLLFDMVLRPMLAESALEPSRDLALQSLDALDDEPQQKVFIELRHRHYGEPFGRSPLGKREDIEKVSIGDVCSYAKTAFVPSGSILGFAGKFDWNELKDQVGDLTAGWKGSIEPYDTPSRGARGYTHQTADTTQVHIGLAYDALPETAENSIYQRAAIAVLSGGMSGRLFTEVREKRGLCYSVYASYTAGKTRGSVFSYAGTTAPRAQETLDVLTGEIRRLADGIKEDEFTRAIVGMKSRLVMQGESTHSRAHAIAFDQYLFGRPRSLDELSKRVDAVKLADVNKFVLENPPPPMTLVTIGPSALEWKLGCERKS